MEKEKQLELLESLKNNSQESADVNALKKDLDRLEHLALLEPEKMIPQLFALAKNLGDFSEEVFKIRESRPKLDERYFKKKVNSAIPNNRFIGLIKEENYGALSKTEKQREIVINIQYSSSKKELEREFLTNLHDALYLFEIGPKDKLYSPLLRIGEAVTELGNDELFNNVPKVRKTVRKALSEESPT